MIPILGLDSEVPSLYQIKATKICSVKLKEDKVATAIYNRFHKYRTKKIASATEATTDGIYRFDGSITTMKWGQEEAGSHASRGKGAGGGDIRDNILILCCHVCDMELATLLPSRLRLCHHCTQLPTESNYQWRYKPLTCTVALHPPSSSSKGGSDRGPSSSSSVPEGTVGNAIHASITDSTVIQYLLMGVSPQVLPHHIPAIHLSMRSFLDAPIPLLPPYSLLPFRSSSAMRAALTIYRQWIL